MAQLFIDIAGLIITAFGFFCVGWAYGLSDRRELEDAMIEFMKKPRLVVVHKQMKTKKIGKGMAALIEERNFKPGELYKPGSGLHASEL